MRIVLAFKAIALWQHIYWWDFFDLIKIPAANPLGVGYPA